MPGGVAVRATLQSPAGRECQQQSVTQPSSGVTPADAARMQQLQGWHVARAEDFSGSALRLLREHRLEPSGHIMGDFGGRGAAVDSAYLLVDANGRKRVSMLARGMVAYDAIFPQADAAGADFQEHRGEDTMDVVGSAVSSRWRCSAGYPKRERSNRKRGAVETRHADLLCPPRRFHQD